MELMITGKNMELTPAVRRYIERKLGKLNRYLSNIIESKVEISEEKTKSPQHHFAVRVVANGRGVQLRSEKRGKDLFRAIDKVAATMTRQLDRYKGKRDEKGRGYSLARNELSTEISTGEKLIS